jgi:hypothetical protein
LTANLQLRPLPRPSRLPEGAGTGSSAVLAEPRSRGSSALHLPAAAFSTVPRLRPGLWRPLSRPAADPASLDESCCVPIASGRQVRLYRHLVKGVRCSSDQDTFRRRAWTRDLAARTRRRLQPTRSASTTAVSPEPRRGCEETPRAWPEPRREHSSSRTGGTGAPVLTMPCSFVESRCRYQPRFRGSGAGRLAPPARCSRPPASRMLPRPDPLGHLSS